MEHYNWHKSRRIVRNLRERIFKATREGNLKKIRNLQRLLLKSYSNILQSVRRATQENKGKFTPGIDKIIVKTPAARGILVDALCKQIPWKPLPTKRTYIKKKSGKLRPLSIPSIVDRCLQGIHKNALEPYWEAQFEPSSYGCRPGRSCHDALQDIYSSANSHSRNKWVLDADIDGCFDNINHDQLMELIGNYPGKDLIRKWLKSGYLDNSVFHITENGVPQGSIISPLLANIALHGLEIALGTKWRKVYKKDKVVSRRKGNTTLIRYADDLVVLCRTKNEAEEATDTLKRFLNHRGLQFSSEKTNIVHLEEGFDFLGWNIRQYKDIRFKQETKLLTKPSKESINSVKEKLRTAIREYRDGDIKIMIVKINEIIRGWANYHRAAVARKTFEHLDDWMWTKLQKVATRRHPKKTPGWCKRKYFGRFHPNRRDKWIFGDKQSGIFVLKFCWFNIERHAKIKGDASPDNPELRPYWKQRQENRDKNRVHAELTGLKRRVALRQNCRCPIC
ncbi:group II intron reverse transcriptase/maturase [cyanobacterium TDX16]|nr:group II intron reverse transcriptase/maturase [cyanobacterium TDX16]